MVDPCERCGLEPWFANTGEHFDSARHCLAHCGALHQMAACASRELTRLREEVPVLRAQVTKLTEQVERAKSVLREVLGKVDSALEADAATEVPNG